MSNSTNTIICEHCGAVIDLDNECYNTINMDDGTTESWCESCTESHACYCEHCEDYCESTHTVNVRTYGGRVTYEDWCGSCVEDDAATCEDCGELWATEDLCEEVLYTGEVVMLCYDCRDNNYSRCERCDNLVPDDDVVYRDWTNYCPDCAPSENLHDYGHTTGNYFWLADGKRVTDWCMTADLRKRLFLGIELETDNNDDAGELADDIANEYDEEYVVCKEDGSLHDEGVEIVSQPMEPLYHLTSGLWENIVRIVRSHGGESHDAGTCGLHIHLSRKALSDDVTYRIDRMFHRFKEEMVRFSRRTDFYYCHLEDDDLAEIATSEERRKVWREKKDWEDRYHAVNDRNAYTIEIRLWRGSLNIETIKATIEMTAGLAFVCDAMSDELADTLTWSMFKLLVRFALEQHGISHAELDSYLVRRGL